MKILLVAATKNEVKPFLQKFPDALSVYKSVGKNEVKVLVTGAGILSTSVELCINTSAIKPDLVINVGISGAINPNLNLGEVVLVTSDTLGDFGAESADGFIPAEDLGLINTNEFPFENGVLRADGSDSLNGLNTLQSIAGVTVQKVHGNLKSIDELIRHFPNAQVESMEGAAVFYVCKKMGVACSQVRSISNYVEVRNRESWNIPLAVKTLNDFLFKVFFV